MFVCNLFRKVLLSCGLLLMLAGAAQAQQKIVIVGGTSTPFDDNDLKTFVAGIYGSRATVNFPGVDYYAAVDTNSALVTELNAADLVICSRSLNSGTYATTARTPIWNGLTSKIFSISPYTARSTKWGWMTTDTLTNIAFTGYRATTVPPTDPIFNNVVTTSTGGMRVFATPVNLGYSTVSALSQYNGTVLATIDGIANAPMIIRWTDTTKSYNSVVTGQKPAGPRMLFTVEETAAGTNPAVTGPSMLNANGKTLLANAIMSMLPTPQTAISTSLVTFSTANVVLNPNSVTTRTVMLTNTGNQALNFVKQGSETNQGLVLTGAPACITISKVSQATSTPLAPGATLTITLKFAPTAADWNGSGVNNKTATLSIFTDGPTPRYDVSITAATVPVEMSRFAAE